MKKDVRRWRSFACFTGENREEEAAQLIKDIEGVGFKAKIHAPLKEHENSGHIHITVLCTREERVQLSGLVPPPFFEKKLKMTMLMHTRGISM
jgi:hypothetical protein